MKNISIVIIGDEILLGRVTDTNSGLIARTFSEAGWHVEGVRTVGDDADAMRRAIEDSLSESRLVITTGGLGPTRDDITKPLLAEIFGGDMIQHAPTSANIERIFAERSLALNELTRKQAWVPSSCRVIVNVCGTAPIMWFEREGRVLVAMPGVPYETRSMLPEVMTRVSSHFGSGDMVRHSEFDVRGISESDLAEHLADYEDGLPLGYKLAYLPGGGKLRLRLDSAPGANAESFGRHCSALSALIAPYLMGTGSYSQSRLLIEKLRTAGATLATAESCTGGNIAHTLTLVPGCSDVYKGSVVSYANSVKTGLLGVEESALATCGAVSESVVSAMAEGVAAAIGATHSVATSGIAGPGGGSADKPVGTVWIAAHTPERTQTKCVHISGDRATVIERATTMAIDLLLDIL